MESPNFLFDKTQLEEIRKVGPTASDLDFERFRENLIKIKSQQKRKKTILPISIGIIIATLSIAGTISYSLYQKELVSAYSNIENPYKVSKLSEQRNMHKASGANQNIVKNQISNYNNAKQKTKTFNTYQAITLGNKEAYTQEITDNSAALLQLIQRELVLDLVQFQFQEIKQNLPLNFLIAHTLSTKKMTPTFSLEANTTFFLSNSSWRANSQTESHKDISEITAGMKSRGSGFQLGSDLVIRFHKNKLSVGLHYQSQNRITNFNTPVNNIPIIDLNTQTITGYFYRPTNPTEIENIQQKVSSVQVPVQLHFPLVTKNRFKWTAGFGSSMNLQLQKKVIQYDLNYMRERKVKQSRIQPNIIASTKIETRFTGNLNLGISLLYMYGKGKEHLTHSQLKQYQHSVGIQPHISIQL